MDDPMLFSKAVQADPEAFGRIAGAYQDQAYTLAFYLLGDASAAEGAAQAAFLAARRRMIRSDRNRLRLDLFREILRACSAAQNGARPSPGGGAGNATGEEKLRGCLAGLPFEYRCALVLVDVAGLDYAEAAAVIGRPVAALQKRLALARVRLCQALRL